MDTNPPKAATQLRSAYDVVVVGGGPAGTAAAVGYARRGATALLVEANPKAAGRFAGEWIHPSGARILRDLELTPHAETAEHAPCRGFAVFPDDGSEPVRLDYDTPDGVIGFSCEHGDLVNHLRRQAAEIPGLDYLPLARVIGIEGEDVCIQRKGKDELRIRAGVIVGADGRSSVVRKHLRGEEAADVVSHMAGLTLKDIELPFEGYGTVLLGGPGPVLLYRIAPNLVRACIDLPASHPGGRRDARYLWEAFRARFPAALRGAFRRALESEKLIWACNRFHPRAFYGSGNIALVGDAVGFYHPLTASGITVGLKDGKALYEAAKVSDYHRGREPESYVPELLSNALNQVFVREDESAAAIRSAVFETWRKKPAERDRTMHILAGDEVRLPEFAKAFVKVAGQALGDTLTRRPTSSIPSDIAAFVEWAQWPAATAMPAMLRRRIRGASSALHPMQGIKIRPSSPDLGDALEDTTTVDLDVDALLAKVAPDEGMTAHTPVFHAAEALATSVRERRELSRLREDLAVLVALTPETPADRRATASALATLQRAYQGLEAATVAKAQAALVRATRGEQRKEGAFGVSLAHTALGLETLAFSGVPTYDPAIRRALRALAAGQHADGSWGDAVTTALVARAIFTSEVALVDAAERGLATLEAASYLGPEAGEALALYRDLRTQRLVPPKARRKAPKVVIGKPNAADLAYCKDALLAVSRTFARPIQMLEEPLQTAVMCGYLLCRIADTIEDHDGFTVAERDARYALWLEALVKYRERPDHAAVRAFEASFEGVDGVPAEMELAMKTGTVLRVFATLPDGMQVKTLRWVAEMTRGMQLYSHRAPGHDGIAALHTVEDLERYCYFVAGTVGHMLTDLFVEAFGEEGGPMELGLRKDAEAFGVGLQLVNILKDVTDDRERAVSFIPRVATEEKGLPIGDLTDPAKRDVAHASVAPLFDRAEDRLRRALEYTLAIPADQVAVRLFCLLPLWMAARTLVHARGNDAMFTAGQAVKISRAEVEQLINECVQNARDDVALRNGYAQLWQAPASSPRPAATVH